VRVSQYPHRSQYFRTTIQLEHLDMSNNDKIIDLAPIDELAPEADPNSLGTCRLTININTLENRIEFSNATIGKMFSQNELAFLVNPLLWSGIRALLLNKMRAADIVAPTAKQTSQIDKSKIIH
jgi:hypothetical protein